MWQIMKNCARKLCQILSAFLWSLVPLERCGGPSYVFVLISPCSMLATSFYRTKQIPNISLILIPKMKKNLSNSLLFVPTTHWCMQSRRGCTPIIQGQNWNSYNNRPLLYSLVIVNWTKKPHEFWFFHLWLLTRHLQH